MKKENAKKDIPRNNKPGERRKGKPRSGSERRRVAKEAPASNVPTAPTYKIHNIAVDEIEVSGKRRQFHPEKAKDLMGSIAKIGLRTPLTIRLFSGKKLLITGFQRLEAVKVLGWKTVPCVYIKGGAKVARLWEISENLHRANLTALEESELIAEWLKLTEQKDEEDVSPQNGQKGKIGRPKGGVSEAARKLPGKGTQSAKRHKIERAAKRAAILKDVKPKIVDAGFADSPTKLDAIASKPDKEAQQKELERLQAGHRETGGDGAENLPSAGFTLFAVMNQQWFAKKKLLRTHWERAGHKDRTRFIKDVLKYPLGAGAKNGANHEKRWGRSDAAALRNTAKTKPSTDEDLIQPGPGPPGSGLFLTEPTMSKRSSESREPDTQRPAAPLQPTGRAEESSRFGAGSVSRVPTRPTATGDIR